MSIHAARAVRVAVRRCASVPGVPPPTRIARASALHRQAAAVAAVVGPAVDGYPQSSGYARQHELSAQLRSGAARLAPGWLGAPLDAVPAGTLVASERSRSRGLAEASTDP